MCLTLGALYTRLVLLTLAVLLVRIKPLDDVSNLNG
jgi:hypothetical protein